MILLGGKGTRLSDLYPDRPKALVPVAGRPFLAWQLEWLFANKVERVLLAAGHMGAQIKAWISRQPYNNRVSVLIEPKPLGTGGAVKYALGRNRKGTVLVLNGDSLVPNLDFKGMEAGHAASGLPGTIAVTRIENAGRYGAVIFDRNGRITRFEEKKKRGAGWINAGIYLLDASIFSAVRPKIFISIENEIFPALAAGGRLGIFKSKPPPSGHGHAGRPAEHGIISAPAYVGKIMKQIYMCLACWLVCYSYAHGDSHTAIDRNAIAILIDSTNYAAFIESPLEKLSVEEQQVMEMVRKGKAPTHDAAQRILLKRAENQRWTRDARTRKTNLGLRRLVQDVEVLGKTGDPVWIIEVNMDPTIFRQVFLINARNGEVLAITLVFNKEKFPTNR